MAFELRNMTLVETGTECPKELDQKLMYCLRCGEPAPMQVRIEQAHWDNTVTLGLGEIGFCDGKTKVVLIAYGDSNSTSKFSYFLDKTADPEAKGLFTRRYRYHTTPTDRSSKGFVLCCRCEDKIQAEFIDSIKAELNIQADLHVNFSGEHSEVWSDFLTVPTRNEDNTTTGGVVKVLVPRPGSSS